VSAPENKLNCDSRPDILIGNSSILVRGAIPMAIKTACSKCGAAYMLAESQQGKPVRCRSCRSVFTVEPIREVEEERPRSSSEVTAERPAAHSTVRGGHDTEFEEPRRRRRDDPDDRRDRRYRDDPDRRSRPRRSEGPNMALWVGLGGGLFVLLIIVVVLIAFGLGAFGPGATSENLPVAAAAPVPFNPPVVQPPIDVGGGHGAGHGPGLGDVNPPVVQPPPQKPDPAPQPALPAVGGVPMLTGAVAKQMQGKTQAEVLAALGPPTQRLGPQTVRTLRRELVSSDSWKWDQGRGYLILHFRDGKVFGTRSVNLPP
jgi:hypothetical protein